MKIRPLTGRCIRIGRWLHENQPQDFATQCTNTKLMSMYTNRTANDTRKIPVIKNRRLSS